MARGHRGWNFQDQLLAVVSCAATLTRLSPVTFGQCRYAAKFLKISSGERVHSIQQVFLAGDSSDLIAQLAVLEKEQGRNGANVVLERKALVFVHVNLRN